MGEERGNPNLRRMGGGDVPGERVNGCYSNSRDYLEGWTPLKAEFWAEANQEIGGPGACGSQQRVIRIIGGNGISHIAQVRGPRKGAARQWLN